MKLINEQEIKDLAKSLREDLYRKWTGNMCMEQARDIEDLIVSIHTQAQQDLVASAGEEFDEWWKHNWSSEITAEDIWRASQLSHAKKMQEKDAEIERLKESLAQRSALGVFE